MTPHFTIITATYNAASAMPRLLGSLAGQICRDFEVIIQDGGSTDGTVQVAEGFRTRLPHLQLRSVPDTGIYDAWNKALKHARGTWIIFLGADDFIESPDFLEKATVALHNAPDRTQFALCCLKKMKLDGNFFKPLQPDTARIYDNLHRGQMFPHTALFHNRDIFIEEQFDVFFKVAGDYDLICRVWTPNTVAVDIPEIMISMGGGGISANPRSALLLRHEVTRILKRYAPKRLYTFWYLHFMAKGFILYAIGFFFGNYGLRIVERIKSAMGQ